MYKKKKTKLIFNGRTGELTDTDTHKRKPICSLNFFKAGGIKNTIHLMFTTFLRSIIIFSHQFSDNVPMYVTTNHCTSVCYNQS